jgi:hypothetical protein
MTNSARCGQASLRARIRGAEATNHDQAVYLAKLNGLQGLTGGR